MTKQPEALRLADVLIGSPQFTGTPIWQAADMLRRQHEAIKQLRGTLETISNYVGKSNPPSRIWVRAEKALKDTENLT